MVKLDLHDDDDVNKRWNMSIPLHSSQPVSNLICCQIDPAAVC